MGVIALRWILNRMGIVNLKSRNDALDKRATDGATDAERLAATAVDFAEFDYSLWSETPAAVERLPGPQTNRKET